MTKTEDVNNLKFYFCGIGGCGMNPLAHFMKRAGYRVCGSDIKESEELADLRKDGIECFARQDGSMVEGCDVFVYSSAIHEDNPDLVQAKKLGLSFLHRSELLAQIARRYKTVTVAGAHGKTTVSSLIACLLKDGGLDPNAIVGGYVPAFRGNFTVGKGCYLVLEADESDGTFKRYASDIAVLLNVDADHLDYYKDMNAIKEAFAVYVGNIVENGTLIYNAEDPVCAELAAGVRPDIKKIKCGIGVLAQENADYAGTDILLSPLSSAFSLLCKKGSEEKSLPFVCPLPGRHNVFNAVISLAAAAAAGVDPEILRDPLAVFKNAHRRFERLGKWHGAEIIDDYAHHPREIEALLNSASRLEGDLTVVFQPHRFSRTEKLLPEFARVLSKAPNLILTDVYSAGESKNLIGGRELYEAVLNMGGQAEYVNTPAEIPALLLERSKGWKFPHTLLFTGAGALSGLAHEMLKNQ
ncbi:UDP-N-acetylmuramate--L-alanine ligase [bacterium]|nr:UDP-N-acetylmuramate--L-alanine ligase [bacterium]